MLKNDKNKGLKVTFSTFRKLYIYKEMKDTRTDFLTANQNNTHKKNILCQETN